MDIGRDLRTRLADHVAKTFGDLSNYFFDLQAFEIRDVFMTHNNGVREIFQCVKQEFRTLLYVLDRILGALFTIISTEHVEQRNNVPNRAAQVVRDHIGEFFKLITLFRQFADQRTQLSLAHMVLCDILKCPVHSHN